MNAYRLFTDILQLRDAKKELEARRESLRQQMKPLNSAIEFNRQKIEDLAFDAVVKGIVEPGIVYTIGACAFSLRRKNQDPNSEGFKEFYVHIQPIEVLE